MKKLLIAIWMLLLLLLGTNTIWFVYLDKKIDRVIERQNEINGKTYEVIQAHEKSLRIIETNNEIMFSIIVDGDYYEKD